MNQFSNLSAENSMHSLARVASNEVASDTLPIMPRNARKAYRASVIASHKPSAIDKAFSRHNKRDFAVSVVPAFRKLHKQIRREVEVALMPEHMAVDSLMDM